MTIDWWTLGLQAVNFAVLVWLLRRFLYAPVRKVIAARKAQVEAAQAEAVAAKAAAEAEAAALKAAQAALAASRDEVLAKAAAEAEVAAKAVVAQARAAADALLAKAQEAIAAERKAAVAGAQADVAGLAAGLAGRILADTAAKVAPGAFLDGLAEALEALPAGERDRLAADMAAPGAVATVVTARPLAPEDHAVWSARLVPLLGGTGTLAFAEDAAILGGAELRLAHSVLKFGWADRIAAAEGAMSGDE
jgi:F-type H+-transporting ATPase subunit b